VVSQVQTDPVLLRLNPAAKPSTDELAPMTDMQTVQSSSSSSSAAAAETIDHLCNKCCQ